MANAKRGMCDLHVEGITLRLVFDFNAICELESVLNESFADCAKRWAQHAFTMREVRAMVWAGLQANHPDYTMKQCGELIGKIGIEHLSSQLVEAFSQSFPGKNSGDAEQQDSHEGNEKAGVGIGTVS